MNLYSTPQATSPLSMWLDYLTNIHTSAIDLGLDRVQKVAVTTQLNKPAPRVITVAGTNGKGSTCALLEAILIQAGYRVGVYSSPHLIHYRERVRVDGIELADEIHSAAFSYIENHRGSTSLSFFEYGTLAALHIFRQQKVDVAILEVGLGGRLDATNIVDHDVSVITSLAIDHVDWLGSDINVIGFEKAGIYRSGKPAICGQPNPPSTVSEHANKIGAEFYQVDVEYRYSVVDDHCWQWQSNTRELLNLPIPALPLPNAATALMALECSGLDVPNSAITNGLKLAQLAGRMQIIRQEPAIILDVAHNPHSAQYLAQQLSKRYAGKRIHAVIGMLHDKDIKETLHNLMGLVTCWYPASLTGPRAAVAQQLIEYLPGNQCGFHSPVEAFKAALTEATAEDVIIVVGSFHTVGEVLQYWQTQGE
jgi:dihydrofolate synthase / folylpolyglutamate synthase